MGNDDDKIETEEDEEAKSLAQHWLFVKRFLNEVKNRGEEGLSEASAKIINEVNEEIGKYKTKEKHLIKDKEIKNEDSLSNSDGTKSEISALTGESEQRLTKTKKRLCKRKHRKEQRKESSSDSDSYKSLDMQRQQKQRQKTKSYSSSSETGNEKVSIKKMLKCLDMRKVPQLEMFDDTSGLELKRYLEKFEEYCKQNFRGKRYLWISEMERKFTGKTLEAFKSLRQFENDYDDMKDKMLNWYKEESALRKATARKKFDKAKIKPNESTYTFSSRLENLFKVAYPKHDVSRSEILLYKYKASVPKQMNELISSQILQHKLQDRKIRWDKVQKCARLFDVERNLERNKTESSEEKDNRTIVIN